ncbi:hypothetical protein KM043_003447 [Ampulex compressa]|nr:hypothetical protein KM043_003447 [Ampulex compressa]
MKGPRLAAWRFLLILGCSVEPSRAGSCGSAKLCCQGRDSGCVIQKESPNAIIASPRDKPCYCDHACLKLADCCDDFKETCGVVDCEVSEWSPWTPCNNGCGSGTQKRTRVIEMQEKNGGKHCPRLDQVRTCRSFQACHDAEHSQHHEKGAVILALLPGDDNGTVVGMKNKSNDTSPSCVAFTIVRASRACVKLSSALSEAHHSNQRHLESPPYHRTIQNTPISHIIAPSDPRQFQNPPYQHTIQTNDTSKAHHITAPFKTPRSPTSSHHPNPRQSHNPPYQHTIHAQKPTSSQHPKQPDLPHHRTIRTHDNPKIHHISTPFKPTTPRKPTISPHHSKHPDLPHHRTIRTHDNPIIQHISTPFTHKSPHHPSIRNNTISHIIPLYPTTSSQATRGCLARDKTLSPLSPQARGSASSGAAARSSRDSWVSAGSPVQTADASHARRGAAAPSVAQERRQVDEAEEQDCRDEAQEGQAAKEEQEKRR